MSERAEEAAPALAGSQARLEFGLGAAWDHGRDAASFPSNTDLCGLWDHPVTLDWSAGGTCWSYPAVALQDDLLNVFLSGTEVQSWAMSESAQLKAKELSGAEGEIPAQESLLVAQL